MNPPARQVAADDGVIAKLATLDRLVTIDFPRRGVIDMIASLTRARFGRPVAGLAAETLIERTRPGQLVLIATGWLDRPHVSTRVAESDGPPGAAVLARALHDALGLVPLLLVESELVDPMEQLLHTAGLRCLSPDEALLATESTSALHAASVIALPKEWNAADELARRLLAQYSVGAFVAIEKGGMNRVGRIHTSRGADTTDTTAKADAVLLECTRRSIPSVGIGDGGNEIGMGSIGIELRPLLRFGEDCGCPCGGGVTPENETDVLVPATVSNWGGYAIVAALAILLRRPDLLHTAEAETSMLETSRRTGLIDGASGYVTASADGLDINIHRRIVTLLAATAGAGVNAGIWADEGGRPPRAIDR
ncbi:MAG TPA: glutamate cyclase domain-containing protein [Acidimicrobiia bacterium]|nr:glutamate cyclase domain-containing protein [Acidimicrobiia bacterium]